MLYGYARVSTRTQSINRQIENIKDYAKEHFQDDPIIFFESGSGKTFDRTEWKKLKKKLVKGDSIIFEEVSRFSRDAEEGFACYEELMQKGIDLYFIKMPHINTSVYRETLSSKQIELSGTDIDVILKAINQYLMILAKKQIQLAFDQSQKERELISSRTSNAMFRNGCKNIKDEDGKIIEQGKISKAKKGSTYHTKKSDEAKQIIRKYSKEFGGSCTVEEIMIKTHIARNTYFKYLRELKEEYRSNDNE